MHGWEKGRGKGVHPACISGSKPWERRGRAATRELHKFGGVILLKHTKCIKALENA